MATSDLKIKNDNPNGQSIRVQAWDGKIPTYDSEAQRATAAASAFDVDSPPAEGGEPVEKLPEGYDKFLKPQLIELANARKEAGKEIHLDEADTVKVLREKIEATYPVVEESEESEESESDEPQPSPVAARYDFNSGNLLQEKTLAVGEEKVFSVSSGTFITIQIDE